ncbi:prepilin-type N-terminal cleavage/methylation domain-containing protein [Phycisphaera mikurensis]|uniref:Prepilin-type N-terminal cleavage/methylation domain-containing protein n=1 Tax=Phycisphaera mikurensis (strain NBRC 102666 / KCTC 22515 / FYK2301M01) TaxID=1142394 RepID=I0IHN1_PHYMF|nr:prepilin-type N-terminal cleavage/methylation domain-containing protein [Phycisphaera mikurensis]MBB6441014.1 prepilin-type N-terminal cleavage/methylation domain-containing protein/prepilin-type processing-associated H-X9-DG protein [Phycisphaera mikurensis]BAM04769.1 hypothetical protein PSMK_26100 [Phycisphaera mikurensis NBRC 102666]
MPPRPPAPAVRGRRCRCRCSAFTLIELLAVVSIVGLLVGLLLPVLAAARIAANHVVYLSAARQLCSGYTAYHADHGGDLLLGYTPPAIGGVPVTVRDAISGQTFGYPVSDRYPWRLSPWVGDVWPLLHLHAEDPQRPAAGDAPPVAQAKAYRLSVGPAFGLNSVYLGGHAGPFYRGFSAPGNRPTRNAHVAFRAAEVRDAAAQVVFAESRLRNAGSAADPDAGLHFVSPPRANGRRWVAAGGGFEIASGLVTGLPLGRHGPAAATAFFDGHAASRTPEQLADMRGWAPRATDADWDFRSP